MFSEEGNLYKEYDYKKEWKGRICSNDKVCQSKDKVYADDDKFFICSEDRSVLCPKCVKNKKIL
jgi:hypothetical protein